VGARTTRRGRVACLRARREGACWLGVALVLCVWVVVDGEGGGVGGPPRWDHLFGKNAVGAMRDGLPKGWVNIEAGPVPWYR